MTSESRGWEERLGAWLGARWQWLVMGVLLLFALNNVVGILVGAVGMLLFAHRIAGRLLGAGRVVAQIQEIVGDSDPADDA